MVSGEWDGYEVPGTSQRVSKSSRQQSKGGPPLSQNTLSNQSTLAGHHYCVRGRTTAQIRPSVSGRGALIENIRRSREFPICSRSHILRNPHPRWGLPQQGRAQHSTVEHRIVKPAHCETAPHKSLPRQSARLPPRRSLVPP